MENVELKKDETKKGVGNEKQEIKKTKQTTKKKEKNEKLVAFMEHRNAIRKAAGHSEAYSKEEIEAHK